jgi:hypothetical protein
MYQMQCSRKLVDPLDPSIVHPPAVIVPLPNLAPTLSWPVRPSIFAVLARTEGADPPRALLTWACAATCVSRPKSLDHLVGSR